MVNINFDTNRRYGNTCVHKYWRKYLEFKLKTNYNANLTRSPSFDIGNFWGAKKIGFCFNGCTCTKSLIDKIYKNQDYYSESYTLNNKSMIDFKNKNLNMYDNSRWIVKKDYSMQGKGIIPTTSWSQVMKLFARSNEIFVLQKEIPPALHNGYKFDFRQHFILIKENNNYQAYFIDYGFTRIQSNKFSKNNNNSFKTNLSGTNNKYALYKTFLKSYDPVNYQKRKDDLINLTRKVGSKFADYIRGKNELFFSNKPGPKYQIMIIGIDIMFDNNNKPYLIELNNLPGFLENKRSEKLLNIEDKIMVNNIWNDVLVQWMNNKSHNMNSNKYFTRC
jgi:hypothetical protein